MENEIEMNIKCYDPIIKRATSSGSKTASTIRLPGEYNGKELCLIPVSYKVKVGDPNEKGVYNFNIRSNVIFNKVLHNYRNVNYCNLPFEYLGIDFLIFSKPGNNY